MNARWLPVLLVAAGCSSPPTTPPSDLGVTDAPPWKPNLTGRWAAELGFHFPPVDGGAPVNPFQLLAIFNSVEKASGEVDAKWELCGFPVPALGQLTDDYWSPALVNTTTGTVNGDGEGAHYLQPAVTFLVGAQLANPATDPLPLDGSHLCADATSTGCVVGDAGNPGHPLVGIATSGLTPDADRVFVDARVRFGFDGVLHEYGVLGATVDPISIEWHVVGCHLASGSDCAPADVAALEAARPSLALSQPTMQWSFQGTYLTCPTFEADPQGTIDGTGMNDVGVDGGAGDGGSVPPVFSTVVQGDLDALGCATGGCHETRTSPGQMHLVYHPTGAQVMQNYQAALPWTGGPPAGGRLVNEVSLPPPMRSRWLTWIANGTPF